jgi:hypothetical protein
VPSTNKKQAKFMAAAAHNPAFAKKVGVPVSVAKEFNQADKGKKFKEGGSMKHSDMSKDKPMMKKVAAEAVKGHEKRMHKMAKGGVTRADGCITKGHTKGKTIAMKKGGAC